MQTLCPFKKETQRGQHKPRGEGDGKMEVEIEMRWLQAQECWQPPGARGCNARNRFSSPVSRRSAALPTP